MEKAIIASGLLAVNFGFAVYCFMTEKEDSKEKLTLPAILLCVVSSAAFASKLLF